MNDKQVNDELITWKEIAMEWWAFRWVVVAFMVPLALMVYAGVADK